MDRFIIRNPKAQAGDGKATAVKRKGTMRQATLHSLKVTIVLQKAHVLYFITLASTCRRRDFNAEI